MNNKRKESDMLFNIQKCSIHDGGGLRTLVFFKGCPLRCLWCANPESQSYKPELMVSNAKCIGCGACVKVCPEGAISPGEDGYEIDRTKCTSCFKCADRCYAESKYIIGKDYTIPELMREVLKDKIFYGDNGGVTFSGGEPLTQPEYLTEIAKACKEAAIHVMLESCAVGDYEKFKSALPYIDAMFIDIKHMTSEIHKLLTGAGNETILKNIRLISDYGIPITARTPVIPGLNDSQDNIIRTAEFIRKVENIKDYELLPYHKLGVNKYKALGKEYMLNCTEPPEDDQIQALVRVANRVLEGSGKECFYTKNNTRYVIK